MAGSSFIWSQFRRKRLNMAGLATVVLLVLVAVFADFLASRLPIYLHFEGETYWFPNVRDPPALRAWDNDRLEEAFGEDDWAVMPLVPWGPNQDDLSMGGASARPPDGRHPLGTDSVGRDVFAGIVHGTRIALSVGFVAVGLYVLIGIMIGAAAGYFGGIIDSVSSRVIEVMLSFPTFFFILTVQGLLPSTSILQLMVVIGLTRWTDVARLVRAEVLRVTTHDYVMAARATGATDLRIVARHVLPNSLGPVLVAASFGVAGAVLVEAALSFLGVGTNIVTPSWGRILNDARSTNYPWWTTFYPGLALFFTLTAYNVVGEGLRDAIDPRLRGDLG
ncbi:MAG: ABC transporter permease [Deltaproteobacteria bacterium]|nr:ABC transporter permease [Deltaproteobacteria bacterium]